LNAAFFGANTVKVPSPLSVGAKPAALTAVTSVDKPLFPRAAPAMVIKEAR